MEERYQCPSSCKTKNVIGLYAITRHMTLHLQLSFHCAAASKAWSRSLLSAARSRWLSWFRDVDTRTWITSRSRRAPGNSVSHKYSISKITFDYPQSLLGSLSLTTPSCYERFIIDWCRSFISVHVSFFKTTKSEIEKVSDICSAWHQHWYYFPFVIPPCDAVWKTVPLPLSLTLEN